MQKIRRVEPHDEVSDLATSVMYLRKTPQIYIIMHGWGMKCVGPRWVWYEVLGLDAWMGYEVLGLDGCGMKCWASMGVV